MNLGPLCVEVHEYQLGYEGKPKSINSIKTTNLIIIIYEIERRKKKSKGIILGFDGREKTNEMKKRM